MTVAGAAAGRWSGELAAYGLAAAGAAVAWALGLPLALLIGPMVTLTVAAQRWHFLHVSKPVYGAALVVIGLSLGQYFTPEIIATWRNISGALALNAAMSVLGTALGYGLLRYLLGYDPATAVFAALPGGILTVMEVSRVSEADAATVLFFQVFRIILGATLIPLAYAAAGYVIPPSGLQNTGPAGAASVTDALLLVVGGLGLAVLGRRLRFPSAEISVPLIWSAVLYGSGVVTMTIPLWLPALSFVVIGASIGTLLPRPSLSRLIVQVAHTALLFALFIVLTAATALAATAALGLPFDTGILTFSPASLTEMIAVSAALDLDPAMVAANNMFRMIFCSLLAPMLLFLVGRRALSPHEM